jgi:hypothetical protein
VTAIATRDIPRRILVEYSAIEAATTLGAIVGRREFLRERVRNAHLPEAWLRELADVDAAEKALRLALNAPRDDWGDR